MAEPGTDLYDSNMPAPARTSAGTPARGNAREVRDYSLYGESQHLPDVVHCETIAQRSVLHDWEFAPHRHDRLHQLLLLRVGGGTVRLGESTAALLPGSLVNVPVGEIHAFKFEPGTDGLVLTLADAMRDELLARSPEVRRALDRAWVAPADAATDALLAQLADDYRATAPARALVLRGLAAALLGRAARLGMAADAAAVAATAPGAVRQPGAEAAQLLQRFEALLEAHFRQHWRVADYARALAITPTHLSRVVRGATGAPASQLIDIRLVREARRQLAFTSLHIATIADTLGFADPALFSRVFSRVAGMPPSVFRRRVTGH
jgi:AraC family transcriptional activator of pobA